MSDVIERLPWDSEFFGFPIARVTASTLNQTEAIEAGQRCDLDGIRCCYFLADGADRSSWAAAVGAGFVPIDVRVELTRTRIVAEICGSGAPRLTRAGQPEDEPRLVEIASEAFRQSRFFVDGRFGEDRAREMFAIWCRLGFSRPDLFTLSAVADGKPVGFTTGKMEQAGQGRIELFAVAPESRGQTIGRRMLREVIEEFWRREASSIIVATQGANVAAQRTYQDAGFRTSSSSIWFHRWNSSSR